MKCSGKNCTDDRLPNSNHCRRHRALLLRGLARIYLALGMMRIADRLRDFEQGILPS